jgi:hypothetical protein
MISIASYFILAVAIAVVIVLGYLVAEAMEIRAAKEQIKAMPAGAFQPEDEPFAGKSELAGLLNRFVADFKRADSARILSQFDVERQLAPVAMRLLGVGASTRAFAGLLILIALVVTLLNLSSAVGVLGDTFSALAANAGTSQRNVVQQVQEAMGKVANTGYLAFSMSGSVILGAFLLLAAALGVQREARSVLRQLASWAHSTHTLRLVEAAREGETAKPADFSGVVVEFSRVVGKFSTLSDDLGKLGDFRTELTSAVTSISEAVDKLPTVMKDNMSTLSSTVATEVIQTLTDHHDTLKAILATYADMKLNVAKMEEFISTVTRQHGEAAEALKHLGSLPADTRKLADVCTQLAVTVGDLKAKTEAIPALGIGETRKALVDLLALTEELGKTLRGATGDSSRKLSALLHSLGVLEVGLAELVKQQGDFKKESLERTSNAYVEMSRRLADLDGSVRRSDRGSKIDEMAKQITIIQNRGLFGLFSRGGGAKGGAE